MTSTLLPVGDQRRRRHDRVCLLDDRRLAIRAGSATQVVPWDDVIYLRAAANRTHIVTSAGELCVRAPITGVIRALEGLGCVRIHRGLAVNGAKVRMLIGRIGHGLTLVLENDVRLEAGRCFQSPLRARFGAARRNGGPPAIGGSDRGAPD